MAILGLAVGGTSLMLHFIINAKKVFHRVFFLLAIITTEPVGRSKQRPGGRGASSSNHLDQGLWALH